MHAVPVLLALLALAGCVRGTPPEASGETAEADAAPEAETGIALVELFTSEGCSSCPPADAALARLVEEDRPGVLALAFHVDYWDRLGWRDPFGAAEHSARQRRYAPSLDGRVYTPQAVVNGTRGLVGSREAELSEAVTQALAEPVRVPLAVTATRTGRQIAVATEASGAVPEGAVLHVALVQRSASTDVARGENRGRRLPHTNVVRDWKSGAPEAETVPLAVPPEAGEVFVAAWLQAGETGAVLGLTTAEIE